MCSPHLKHRFVTTLGRENWRPSRKRVAREVRDAIDYLKRRFTR